MYLSTIIIKDVFPPNKSFNLTSPALRGERRSGAVKRAPQVNSNPLAGSRNEDLILMRKFCAILLVCSIIGCGYTKTGHSSDGLPLYPMDLQIIYTASGSTINSVESWLGNRSHQIRCILSASERSKIYSVLKNIEIDSIEVKINSTMSQKASDRSLWFKYGSLEKSISWDSYSVHNNGKMAQLEQLQVVLDDVLFNNPFYQVLPPPDSEPTPRGGFR